MLRELAHGRSTRLWLGGGTLAFLSVAGLGWFLLPGDSASEAPGQMLVEQAAVAPPPNPSPLPVTARMTPVPIAPTASNGRKAEQQMLAVSYEKRDRDWGPRSEAAIQQFLGTIPYIGGNRYLAVKCSASACEVIGIADPDAATGTMKPVWEVLERDTAIGTLRAHGLERTAIIFDTGRSGDEFKIYYGRAAPAPEPQAAAPATARLR
ncbi:hypothetical protein P1X14_14370 [Sphingomonas sp. AOB5]|uniref:hypothetical protein n=1 Tax=Sphingomonas sp. AOB5 TaxID=3034017 RepID=UPI0023F8F422|nr:hypothetical protein [Sphingomonas sp. AOB5]MDF7776436.1 hypothetical protein [Sphingomonas sp. AOB5]